MATCRSHRQRLARGEGTCYSFRVLRDALKIIHAQYPQDALRPNTRYGGRNGHNDHTTRRGLARTLSEYLGEDQSTWPTPGPDRVKRDLERRGVLQRMDDEIRGAPAAYMPGDAPVGYDDGGVIVNVNGGPRPPPGGGGDVNMNDGPRPGGGNGGPRPGDGGPRPGGGGGDNGEDGDSCPAPPGVPHPGDGGNGGPRPGVLRGCRFPPFQRPRPGNGGRVGPAYQYGIVPAELDALDMDENVPLNPPMQRPRPGNGGGGGPAYQGPKYGIVPTDSELDALPELDALDMDEDVPLKPPRQRPGYQLPPYNPLKLPPLPPGARPGYPQLPTIPRPYLNLPPLPPGTRRGYPQLPQQIEAAPGRDEEEEIAVDSKVAPAATSNEPNVPPAAPPQPQGWLAFLFGRKPVPPKEEVKEVDQKVVPAPQVEAKEEKELKFPAREDKCGIEGIITTNGYPELILRVCRAADLLTYEELLREAGKLIQAAGNDQDTWRMLNTEMRVSFRFQENVALSLRPFMGRVLMTREYADARQEMLTLLTPPIAIEDVAPREEVAPPSEPLAPRLGRVDLPIILEEEDLTEEDLNALPDDEVLEEERKELMEEEDPVPVACGFNGNLRDFTDSRGHQKALVTIKICGGLNDLPDNQTFQQDCIMLLRARTPGMTRARAKEVFEGALFFRFNFGARQELKDQLEDTMYPGEYQIYNRNQIYHATDYSLISQRLFDIMMPGGTRRRSAANKKKKSPPKKKAPSKKKASKKKR